MTKKIIRVVGLQRSGNHAIIRWILAQFPNKNKIFLNNVDHGDFSPFETSDFTEINGTIVDKIFDKKQQLKGEVILYSYEDAVMKMTSDNFKESVFNLEFEKNKGDYFGEYIQEFTIIIIRDPFNFFASRLKKLNELTGSKNLNVIKENWITMASLACKESRINHVMHPVITVSYNRWFSDKHYRKNLTTTLGGIFSDETLAQVTQEGGGSSFDGTNYSKMTLSLFWAKKNKLINIQTYKNFLKNIKKIFNSGAQNMNVLDRWKVMQSDMKFKSIFSNIKIIEYSEQIFDELPHTRAFVDSCTTKSDIR